MLFYALFAAYIIYIIFGRDIRMYFWNKKSPQEKYILWRKARAEYNHKHEIVDELQYDYMHSFTNGH